MKMSKGNSTSAKLDTYVGEDTSLVGTLNSKKSLTIYGSVKGAIECQGRVVIGQTGNIEGDILAGDVTISGKIVGNVTATNKLELASTGVLQGDVKTPRLIMEDGSKFDGHCETISNGSTKTTRALPAKETPRLPGPSGEEEKT